MSHVTSLRISMIALATCGCALMLSLSSTQAVRAAATCAAAPKPAAPEGSHWYYRTERASNRKCWYLAADERKARGAARRVEVAAQPEAAPAAAAPANGEGIKRLTQPFEAAAAPLPSPSLMPSLAPRSAPVAANAPVDAAPAKIPDRIANAAEQAAQPARVADTQAPAAAADAPAQILQPAPPAVSVKPAARVDADPMTMLPLALGALAASAFAAGAILFASGARRRQQAIVRIVDLNAKPPRMPRAANLAGLQASPDGAHGVDEDDREGHRRAPWRRQAA